MLNASFCGVDDITGEQAVELQDRNMVLHGNTVARLEWTYESELTKIPAWLKTLDKTWYANLDHCNVKEIKGGTFPGSLEVLWIKNQVDGLRLHPDSFEGLSKLREVEISANKLTEDDAHPGLFGDTKLEKLFIYGNTELHNFDAAELFPGSSGQQLGYLHLANCGLTRVKTGNFAMVSERARARERSVEEERRQRSCREVSPLIPPSLSGASAKMEMRWVHPLLYFCVVPAYSPGSSGATTMKETMGARPLLSFCVVPSSLASLGRILTPLCALPDPPTSSLCSMPQLVALEKLQLYDNNFGDSIKAGAFEGLTALKVLGLDGAGITLLPQGVFAEVSERARERGERAGESCWSRRQLTLSCLPPRLLGAAAGGSGKTLPRRE
jgi:hypothetical protein